MDDSTEPLLLTSTRRRLLAARERGIPFVTIADKSGLTTSWLQKFARGEIQNPGIRTLDSLARALLAK